MRSFSTKVNGKDFDEATKIGVWKKLVNRREYLDPFGYDMFGNIIIFKVIGRLILIAEKNLKVFKN